VLEEPCIPAVCEDDVWFWYLSLELDLIGFFRLVRDGYVTLELDARPLVGEDLESVEDVARGG